MNAPDLPTSLAQSNREAGSLDSELLRLMQSLGYQANEASAQAARASTAIKNRAHSGLAGLLRQNAAALRTANQRDLNRASAAGLAGALLDRLKLGAKDIEPRNGS